VISVYGYENGLLLIVQFVLLAVKIFAFVSALTFSSESYVAAGKATKPPWAIGLGFGVVLQVVLGPINIISIAFTIAAFVYLADVRPALGSLKRR
jgi:hypothetical protein